nr:MAG TPA: hypothetical protein [Caudoviricetes sp.]
MGKPLRKNTQWRTTELLRPLTRGNFCARLIRFSERTNEWITMYFKLRLVN